MKKEELEPSKTESVTEFQAAIAEAKAIDEMVTALRDKIEKFYDQIPEDVDDDCVTQRHMMLGVAEECLSLACEQLDRCNSELECIIDNVERAADYLEDLPTADEARAALKRYNVMYGGGSDD